MQLANKPIPFVDGRTTISHTKIQYPADTAIISALNSIDADKMLPFYTKASSKERMENLYPSSLYYIYSSFQKNVQLLPAFKATSAVEDWKFRTTAILLAGILLRRLLTKQQTNTADVSNQKQTSLLKQPNSAQYPFVSDAKVED